ncbi:hypothetical protein COO91_04089 [Nostoc flagelliforme CCNUN1]|uniref:Uncharacterized protein n=1 Tax=Nostoc flagelliforme CCNUN1 TaxID=2038116 RepID=A0A2K8SRQ1_9NOSO|nr:hypothetical protein [Nostoc flagelliforme]AUB38126.1 hypothetical protein COO91_04089 [Nostoc flagelliforme CCNUN1]
MIKSNLDAFALTRVLVTLLPDDETEFWLQTSQTSLSSVWDNAEDDVYAELL